MCMPFVNREFVFSQPDGTKVRLRGTGNQHCATFTTLDGYTVMLDPATGYYEYAKETDGGHPMPSGIAVGDANPAAVGISPNARPAALPTGRTAFVSPGLPRARTRWQIRREENRMQAFAAMANGVLLPAPPQRQTVGNFVGLCLLIDFPDMPAPLSRQEVDDFCNKPGYSGFGNNGSVRDYFAEESGGRLTYTNIVAPWYTARKPRSYYTDPSVPYPTRARELVLEALGFHYHHGFDFSQLTADSQKYIYAINVFYAGATDNAWSQGLWPHAYTLQSPVTLAPGKIANDYQITDMPSELSLGTFCHENGHMICDFPDLYDYGNESRGVGSYCLMCYGPNVNPKNPIGVGAYLKHAAGWSTRLTDLASLTPNSSVSLPAGRNEFALFRRNKTQYFIIENRARAGRDSSLPDVGLAIWKVDEAGNNSNQEMTPSSHYECSLVQADGANDLEMGVNDGGPGDLFRQGGTFSGQSQPNSNWWDGTVSNLNIHDISAPGPTMTFST